MNFSYGNSTYELEFDVQVTEKLLDTLKELGFLDEDFDIDSYFDGEDDAEDVVSDAIIDYYEDRAESKLEVECDKMNSGKAYDEDFVNADDLERMLDIATFDNFGYLNYGVELVKVRENYDHRGNN